MVSKHNEGREQKVKITMWKWVNRCITAEMTFRKALLRVVKRKERLKL